MPFKNQRNITTLIQYLKRRCGTITNESTLNRGWTKITRKEKSIQYSKISFWFFLRHCQVCLTCNVFFAYFKMYQGPITFELQKWKSSIWNWPIIPIYQSLQSIGWSNWNNILQCNLKIYQGPLLSNSISQNRQN